MSTRKSDYPMRPVRKGRPKSSEKAANKKKTWTSDGSKHPISGKELRSNMPWWKTPLYKLERVSKWARMRGVV